MVSEMAAAVFVINWMQSRLATVGLIVEASLKDQTTVSIIATCEQSSPHGFGTDHGEGGLMKY